MAFLDPIADVVEAERDFRHDNGLGTAADLLGRDIRGKAVFIYSVPTPGGRDHSAAWNGAVRRVNEGGAALERHRIHGG